MTRVSKVLRDLADQMLQLKGKQSHRGKQAWPGRNPESAFSLRTDPTPNTQPGPSSQQPLGRCSHGRVTGQPPEPRGRYAVWPRRQRQRQPAWGPGCDGSGRLARGDGPASAHLPCSVLDRLDPNSCSYFNKSCGGWKDGHRILPLPSSRGGLLVTWPVLTAQTVCREDGG